LERPRSSTDARNVPRAAAQIGRSVQRQRSASISSSGYSVRAVEELANRAGHFLAVREQTAVRGAGDFYEACVGHRGGGLPDAGRWERDVMLKSDEQTSLHRKRPPLGALFVIDPLSYRGPLPQAPGIRPRRGRLHHRTYEFDRVVVVLKDRGRL